MTGKEREWGEELTGESLKNRFVCSENLNGSSLSLAPMKAEWTLKLTDHICCRK